MGAIGVIGVNGVAGVCGGGGGEPNIVLAVVGVGVVMLLFDGDGCMGVGGGSCLADLGGMGGGTVVGFMAVEAGGAEASSDDVLLRGVAGNGLLTR